MNFYSHFVNSIIKFSLLHFYPNSNLFLCKKRWSDLKKKKKIDAKKNNASYNIVFVLLFDDISKVLTSRTIWWIRSILRRNISCCSKNFQLASIRWSIFSLNGEIVAFETNKLKCFLVVDHFEVYNFWSVPFLPHRNHLLIWPIRWWCGDCILN